MPHRPAKVLLVDDREENLTALSALLASPSVIPLLARSGIDALELLLEHDFALALIDVQMPDMDGFELAETMRGSERTRDVPIIFVTAAEHDRHRIFRGYEAGAVDFLHKPIEPHVLYNKTEVFFKMHRQQRQLAADLRERDEMLHFNETFSAMLGHDLRAPLSAIVMSAMVLGKRAEDDTSKKAAARILASGQHMSRMIADLLDLARARLAGGIPVVRRPCDLCTIVERVVNEQREAAPARTIQFERRGEAAGAWDEDRLAQTAHNLIGNAVRHGTPDQPVEVTLDGHADAVVLAVANAGEIPAAQLPHLFTPFHPERPSRANAQGLGLGLYIVERIVAAHGGALDIYSANGRTRFTARLPRDAAAVPAASLPMASP